MSKNSIQPCTQTLLLVEGTHDVDFFTALLRARQLTLNAFQILPLAGKTNLAINLKIIKNDPEFRSLKSLGIVRDADFLDSSTATRIPTAAERACQAVLDTLKNLALAIPSRHGEVMNGVPRTGVFIMPDGVADGMLESLCRFAVNEAPSAHCVDTLFQCVGTQSISPKAWTHAFIAIQADPDLHFGKAATNGYWNLQHAVFDDITKFIVNLDTTA